MKFTIQGRLPGLNEIVNVARGNRYAGAGQKKTETQRCALEIMRQTTGRIDGAISVHFAWYEQNLRRDPDNIIAGQKFVLDGLVACGRLANDTRQYVKEIRHSFPDPDKQNPRVEVEITEFKTESTGL